MQKNLKPAWQNALNEAFTTIEDLCDYLKIKPGDLNNPLLENQPFPLKITKSFADCIEKGNPDDPVLRQILPVTEELMLYPHYSADPVGDLASAPTAGLLHKYHGRALLITTGACAINCRYCFRRNFPYAEYQLSHSRLQAALNYIREHKELTEIILSGGDPLLLSDVRLDELFTQLNDIKHIKRIRIHSRIPVVLTERISVEFIKMLAHSRPQLIMVIHANHANELTPHLADACKQLKAIGVTLLNQSVLLKNVNDTPNQLAKLSEKLFEMGILPYYLHVLDKATGTGHFEVDPKAALILHKQLQTILPGYLVPKLVEEQAGAAYKVLLHEHP